MRTILADIGEAYFTLTALWPLATGLFFILFMSNNLDCPELIAYSAMLFAASVSFIMPIYYYLPAFKKMEAWNASCGKPDEFGKFTAFKSALNTYTSRFALSIFFGAFCWICVVVSTETVTEGYCKDWWNTFDEVKALTFMAWLGVATLVFSP